MPKSSTFTRRLSSSGAEEDVLGLEVAVDDALLVRGFEAREHLPHDVHGLWPGRAPPGALHHRGQLLAAEELHRDVRAVLRGDPEVDDGHHVGVVDLPRGAGLALHAGHEVGVHGVLRQEHLQRDGRLIFVCSAR
jgi:hypothetical protein